MALNTDRIGTTYASFPYEVSRAKVHEYARALGEDDPRFLSDGDDCVAPPTFASLFTIIQPGEALLADDGLGMHWNLVHGNHSYEFGARPMQPGDVVTCTPSIGDIRTRGANEMLTMDVDCRFADDTLAVRATSLLVLLGSAP